MPADLILQGLHPFWRIILDGTKDRCGLAKARSTGKKGPHGPYAAELTPEKEAVIKAAFIHFGLIEE